jgi:para-aminobenzoate synthetase component 1
VEELCGLYSFPNVHQLISTVSSKLKENASLWDLIETSFPMGSMTGVPKHKALQLIDKLEAVNGEIYSGSVGYVDPEGDADFNVIIRSLVYSLKEKYLSLMVGGAITALADADMEYEECLLKAKSFLKKKHN